MSWRFRKTFKLLPGVKLNLTARGLSATLGTAPFSVNVGPRGVYRNISIPGTGIWDRQRIGVPSSQPSGIQREPDSLVPFAPSLISPVSSDNEIRSASTELLGSESMEQLRGLLTDTFNERDVLTKEIAGATHEANSATSRYQKWDRGFLMKRIFKQSFAARKEAADTATAKLEELQEQLHLTTLATEITVDREQGEPYYRMRDDFAVLSECQKIWNVVTEKAIDRIVERSSSSKVITRNPVSFSLDSCDLIQWEQKIPHLQNCTGGDMYIYPGFILYRASKQAFALMDFRVVTLEFVPTHFTEAETIPTDTQVIGQTWALSNKDGSPDRRFRDNYQIPVVHYGFLLFKSRDGLDVRYMCSNAALAERFAKAWAAFRTSLSSQKADDTETTEPTYSSDGIGAAAKRFQTAFNEFANRLLTPTGKGTIPKKDFMAYMATVVEFIAAAKAYMETPDASQFRSAKAKLQRAIETFEGARIQFENSVCDGRMNTVMFTAHTDAISLFSNALNQFSEALASGGTKGR